MRDVGLWQYQALTALIAVACGCATGAPERPEREERPIPELIGTDAGVDDEASGPEGRDPGARDAAASDVDLDVDDPADAASEPEPADADDAREQRAASAGSGAPSMGGATQSDEDEACVAAQLLWSEGFESGDYGNWSSQSYGAESDDDCLDSAISTETAVSGTQSQRSEIRCAYEGGGAHRGYGTLQFDGDELAAELTTEGVGTDAPDGLVNTIWIRLDSDTVFEDGTWLSLLTVEGDCTGEDESDQLLGLGIEDATGRLAIAHYDFGEGGTRTLAADAPALPRRQWVRITTYVNYHAGVMHVWQDGAPVQRATFSRPLQTICKWRWGLYASADNDAIVLFEDDNEIWKLNEPWTDFELEPYLGHALAVCE
jgi:hypothetical protein